MSAENIKILVFSDSHGNPSYIHKAIAMHPDASYIIHLGDGCSDLTMSYPDTPCCTLVTLEGNCDYLGFYEIDRRFRPKPFVLMKIGDLSFFMTHGHKYDVKYGLDSGAAAALANGADVFLFGHTHIPYCKYLPEGTHLPKVGVSDRRILLFNPGSIGQGREYSYGIINIQNGALLASHGKVK